MSERSDEGQVLRVNFNGAGQNSGESLVTFQADGHEATCYAIEYLEPARAYFDLLEPLIVAMWRNEAVRVKTVADGTKLRRIVGVEPV